MTQSGWSAQLTRLIAEQVRRYRKETGMSAQDLATRCAGLGLEISRSTLADLENGRRAALTVPELLVLAAALGVSPLMLVIPLGLQEEMHILPGRPISTWRAADWWQGWRGLDGQIPIGPSSGPLALGQAHEQLVLVAMAPGAEYQATRLNSERGLAGVRKMMRERFGLIPPPLPPELAHVDALAEAE